MKNYNLFNHLNSFVLPLMIFGGNVYSQSDHNHGTNVFNVRIAPHKGELFYFKNLDVEIVMNPVDSKYRIQIYLYKAITKPLTLKSVSGEVFIQYENGKIDTLALENLENPFLYCNPSMIEPFTAVFIIHRRNREYTEHLEYKGILNKETK